MPSTLLPRRYAPARLKAQLDIFLRAHLVRLHALYAKSGTAVNQIDLRADLREVESASSKAVLPPPITQTVLPRKKLPSQNAAVGHAAPQERILARAAQLSAFCAVCNNHGLCLILALFRCNNLPITAQG